MLPPLCHPLPEHFEEWTEGLNQTIEKVADCFRDQNILAEIGIGAYQDLTRLPLTSQLMEEIKDYIEDTNEASPEPSTQNTHNEEDMAIVRHLTITTAEEMDYEAFASYESSLQLYFDYHPEVAWDQLP